MHSLLLSIVFTFIFFFIIIIFYCGYYDYVIVVVIVMIMTFIMIIIANKVDCQHYEKKYQNTQKIKKKALCMCLF